MNYNHNSLVYNKSTKEISYNENSILSVTGTTNQITVSNPSNGSYVLSTPQNIDTATDFQVNSLNIVNSLYPGFSANRSGTVTYGGEQHFKNSSGNGFAFFNQGGSLDFGFGKLVSNAWTETIFSLGYSAGTLNFNKGYYNKYGNTLNDYYGENVFTLSFPNSVSFSFVYTVNGNRASFQPIIGGISFTSFLAMNTQKFSSSSTIPVILRPENNMEFPLYSTFSTSGNILNSKIRINTSGLLDIFYNFNEAVASIIIGETITFSNTSFTYTV